MSTRDPNAFPRWESIWWGPHESSGVEFTINANVSYPWYWNRHAIDLCEWARFVPPRVPLFEAVRQGLGDRLDERWLVEDQGGPILVKRVDIPCWQYRIHQACAIDYRGVLRRQPFPFRIVEPSSDSATACLPAVRIRHPIGMLPPRLARDTLRHFTGRDTVYNNRTSSFWTREEPRPHELNIDLNGRNGSVVLSPEPTAEELAAARRQRRRGQPEPVFPDGEHHRLAIRTAWAIWALVDFAERHTHTPKPSRWPEGPPEDPPPVKAEGE